MASVLNSFVVSLAFFAASCQLFAPFPDPTPQPALAVAPVIAPLVLPAPAHPNRQVDYYELDLPGTEGLTHVWLYVPAQRAPQAKLPAVLIAPAGANLIEGMALGDDDRDEHLPYVEAGFVVVAYELWGDAHKPDAHNQFAKAQGGLVNGLAALSFAKQLPFVNPSAVFAAGHSSAGDAALLLATHAPSLKGAAIYNASGNGCWYQKPATLKRFAASHPHFVDFCQRTRAASHIGHLAVPLFLFTSREDTITKASTVKAFADQLQRAGKTCQFVEVPNGDHYSSMIEDGVPAAIRWMQSLLSG